MKGTCRIHVAECSHNDTQSACMQYRVMLIRMLMHKSVVVFEVILGTYVYS